MRSSLRLFPMMLVIILSGIWFNGCSTSSLSSHPAPAAVLPTPAQQGFRATYPAFDTTNGIIPLPNDILRDPVTGFNAFPGTGEPVDSMNSLRGFSTLGNIIIPFDGLIDPNTVDNTTIQVYNAATGQQHQCAFTVSDDGTNSTVVASPITPFQENTQYIVVITSGVMSTLSNSPVISSNFINFIKSATPLDPNDPLLASLTPTEFAALEGLRASYQPIWQGAEALTGTSRADMPLAFAFTTQDLYNTMQNEIATAQAANVTGQGPVASNFGVPPGRPTPVGVALFNEQAGRPANPQAGSVEMVVAGFEQGAGLPIGTLPEDHIGAIYEGSFQAPWYLGNPADPNSFWSDPPVDNGNPFGGAVDFIAFLPNDGVSNFPRFPVQANSVVIYQHGITTNKMTLFILADAFCQAGIAVFAIDLVDHGQFKYLTNDGDAFINLSSLRSARDNLRQSQLNLAYLARMLVAGTSNVPNVPAGAPAVLGMSLGGIVITPWVAMDSQVPIAVGNVTGGRITGLILNSQTISPQVLAGLAANGIQPGTPEFAQFFLIAQTVVDTADPANAGQFLGNGALAGNNPTHYLLQEVVNDDTVPNSASLDLALASGLTQIDAINPLPIPQATAPFGPGTPTLGLFEYQDNGQAVHGSLLSGPPTTQGPMLTQILNFFGSAGQVSNFGQRSLPQYKNADLSRLFPTNVKVYWGNKR